MTNMSNINVHEQANVPPPLPPKPVNILPTIPPPIPKELPKKELPIKELPKKETPVKSLPKQQLPKYQCQAPCKSLPLRITKKVSTSEAITKARITKKSSTSEAIIKARTANSKSTNWYRRSISANVSISATNESDL